MTPHVQRVLEERNDVTTRLMKLSAFIDGEVFDELTPIEAALLKTQRDWMMGYVGVLDLRLALYVVDTTD